MKGPFKHIVLTEQGDSFFAASLANANPVYAYIEAQEAATELNAKVQFTWEIEPGRHAEPMYKTMEITPNMNAQTFIRTVDQGRLTKKWWHWKGTVEGKEVEIKLYKTWNQIYTIDGVRYGGVNGLRVWEWRNEIYAPWKSWGYTK